MQPKRIQRAANLLNFLKDRTLFFIVRSTKGFSPLEEHVFQQVSDAAGLTGFMHRTNADGDIGRDDRRIMPLDYQQFHAVGKLMFNHFFFERAAAGCDTGKNEQT